MVLEDQVTRVRSSPGNERDAVRDGKARLSLQRRRRFNHLLPAQFS